MGSKGRSKLNLELRDLSEPYPLFCMWANFALEAAATPTPMKLVGQSNSLVPGQMIKVYTYMVISIFPSLSNYKIRAMCLTHNRSMQRA